MKYNMNTFIGSQAMEKFLTLKRELVSHYTSDYEVPEPKWYTYNGNPTPPARWTSQRIG